MLPRLRAEEQSSRISAGIAAQGRALKEGDFERFMGTLEATSHGEGRVRASKPTRREMAELPINVVRVPMKLPKDQPKKKPAKRKPAKPRK